MVALPWSRSGDLGHSRKESTGSSYAQATGISSATAETYLHPETEWQETPARIPIWAAYCLSFQEMFGIAPVTPWVDRTYQSTNILVLYHRKWSLAMLSLFPLSSSRLAQCLDDLRSQRNPAGTMSRGSDELQFALLAPLGNRGDIDIEQLRSCFCRVASVTSLLQ